MNHNNTVIVPTSRDVLNGRGQGVQRHPGNVKYRKLVFANKGIYAKCPRVDKMKISKGIVAAIRRSGGRFLEHNERLDVYSDIGDKKATEKTSQALREGQKDIRMNIYETEEATLTSSMGSNVTKPIEPVGIGKQLPMEDYLQFSLIVLQDAYNSELTLVEPPNMVLPGGQAIQRQPGPLPSPAFVKNNSIYGIPNNAYKGTSSAAMAMALDQFPGARMPQAYQQQFDRRAQFSTRTGEEVSNPSFRLTDMSMGSAFSIRHLLESCRNTDTQPPSGNRGTIESILSSGTLEIIRQSQGQLAQIDQMDLEDLKPSQGEIDAFFDLNTSALGGDRISDMRFSDLSKDRFTDIQDRTRSTEYSEVTNGTNNSGNSTLTDQSAPRHNVSSADSDMAQLLLGLANDRSKDDTKSDKMEE